MLRPLPLSSWATRDVTNRRYLAGGKRVRPDCYVHIRRMKNTQRRERVANVSRHFRLKVTFPLRAARSTYFDIRPVTRIRVLHQFNNYRNNA